MQVCYTRRRCLTISKTSVPDSLAMSDGSASPIHHNNSSPDALDNDVNDNGGRKAEASHVVVVSRNPRPSRACRVRAATRLYGSSSQQMSKGKQQQQQVVKKDDDDDELLEVLQQKKFSSGGTGSCRVVSQLVNSSPEPSQLTRWNLRGMWQLASVLNFLHVFRHLLNINIEFSAEEFETALLSPNDTLSDIHIPLLKAVPPITRMAHGRKTWVTVLCRKIKDWWHRVADGDIPIVASHGAEIDVYHGLDPAVRVLILKAICDIRVEQEDIRRYIDHSIKRGSHLSAFRKERVGGDSYGISYWYEDDPILGHRLYRETRKVELKAPRLKGSHVLPSSTYQWETVATNFDEFQDVADILFSSKNRTEVSLGKKLRNDMFPEIEKVHKLKEKLLKKQHREALLLVNSINMEGFGPGRSLRNRKPVTYTFDDFDRSINEALKVTKNGHGQIPSEPHVRREGLRNYDASANAKWTGPSQSPEPQDIMFSALSPKSLEGDEYHDDQTMDIPDRSNRRRQRPQRYSADEYIDPMSDQEMDSDSDDDIVGEAIFDEEYLRSRKQRRKNHSSSEEDDEYQGSEENGEDEDEEEEEYLNASEDSDEPQRFRKLPGRTRRDAKFKPLMKFQSGLRRSNRATRTRINYRQIELSDSETEQVKSKKPRTSDVLNNEANTVECSNGSPEYETNNDGHEHGVDDEQVDEFAQTNDPMLEETDLHVTPHEKSQSPAQDEAASDHKRRFLDLNQLALVGFDDRPNRTTDNNNNVTDEH